MGYERGFRKTEDQVRDEAVKLLGFNVDEPGVTKGVGQLTTFNQLDFKGVKDKPDGWYLPDNPSNVAIILETKASTIKLGKSQVAELLKNVHIAQTKYPKVVGILYNGEETRVFKGDTEIVSPNELQDASFYTELYTPSSIDKNLIYRLTKRINDCLHYEFKLKNLYHRMIFTACALVAENYGAGLESLKNRDYATFHTGIHSTFAKSLAKSRNQNSKIDILLEEFSAIKMNAPENQDAINSFIDYVVEIAQCINSSEWHGEDVMGIFFNEFNRYKPKTESGQVFTPEHITSFMYRLIHVSPRDNVLDAACGSGGFLVKAMSNMIHEVSGQKTRQADRIKRSQLFGIEYDQEIYALACANMLLHKDGKTNLENLDSRTKKAGLWIQGKNITKVLMNPPFETKFGCLQIVKNVLDNVPIHTECAFILPDKKLEKDKGRGNAILKNHTLKKVIKLPEKTFLEGVSTSIFIFEAGVPQGDTPFIGFYIPEDGLVTLKNQGRHDIHNLWPDIEETWVRIIDRQSAIGFEDVIDDAVNPIEWLDPRTCKSYQKPLPPFEVGEEDFKRTAMNYLIFEEGIDQASFNEQVLNSVLYASQMSSNDTSVNILMEKDGASGGSY